MMSCSHKDPLNTSSSTSQTEGMSAPESSCSNDAQRRQRRQPFSCRLTLLIATSALFSMITTGLWNSDTAMMSSILQHDETAPADVGRTSSAMMPTSASAPRNNHTTTTSASTTPIEQNTIVVLIAMGSTLVQPTHHMVERCLFSLQQPHLGNWTSGPILIVTDHAAAHQSKLVQLLQTYNNVHIVQAQPEHLVPYHNDTHPIRYKSQAMIYKRLKTWIVDYIFRNDLSSKTTKKSPQSPIATAPSQSQQSQWKYALYVDVDVVAVRPVGPFLETQREIHLAKKQSQQQQTQRDDVYFFADCQTCAKGVPNGGMFWLELASRKEKKSDSGTTTTQQSPPSQDLQTTTTIDRNRASVGDINNDENSMTASAATSTSIPNSCLMDWRQHFDSSPHTLRDQSLLRKMVKQQHQSHSSCRIRYLLKSDCQYPTANDMRVYLQEEQPQLSSTNASSVGAVLDHDTTTTTSHRPAPIFVHNTNTYMSQQIDATLQNDYFAMLLGTRRFSLQVEHF